LTHLDKDAFLEVLLSQGKVNGPAERAVLSRRADVDFQEQALCLSAAVLSSWWRHPRSRQASGTPVAWLSEGGRSVIEVHCQCPAAEAVRRFVSRTRHRGHLDELRSPEDLLAQFQQAEELGPLFPGQAIICNTGGQVVNEVLVTLVKQVRTRIAIASEA
jgi:glucokinase